MRYIIKAGNVEGRHHGRRLGYIYAESRDQAISMAEKQWKDEVITDAVRTETLGKLSDDRLKELAASAVRV